MSAEKPSLARGTRDFGPLQMAKRNYIIDTIKAVFKLYAFTQIETPAIEKLSVLTGKYGDEGDQLLFKILNSGDYLNKTNSQDYESGSKRLLPKIAEKGLKYDLTVPFARFVVMNRNDLTFPFKRFQIQPVWRADKPQKGRYREFYQCDADVIGTRSLLQEMEIILIITEVYKRLGLDNYKIVINHREILSGLSDLIGMEGKEGDFCVAIDKLDKIGEEKVFQELMNKGCPENKLPLLSELFNKPENEQLEWLSNKLPANAGVGELRQIMEFIAAIGEGVKIEFDSSLARGLSYYTGCIFEVKPTKTKMGSITAGGRYDDLTGVFGMPDVSGVGISFGLDRIYDVLEEESLFPDSLLSFTKVMITCFDESTSIKSLELASALRKAGIKTEVYPAAAKMKKQFQYADRNKIPFVLMVGPEEINTGNFSLKDMSTGEQASHTIEEVINVLKETD